MTSFLDLPSDTLFPLENLPYGVVRKNGVARPAVRIGDGVLDLRAVEAAGLLDGALGGERPFQTPTLNAFMALGQPVWTAVRKVLQALLSGEDARLKDDAALREQALYPIEGVEVLLPVEIGDYTDFYSSREHATNVGTMFRGAENALMPNWTHLPVGYHGRASSIVASGHDVVRPHGQRKAPDADAPTFGPSKRLDFELEMGFFIGPGNPLGVPVPIEEAEHHIFGLALVNDWSARDIQAWEYVPLGPFLGKNFLTTVSPWIVPFEALEPFRVAAPAQQPEPLPYLRQSGLGAFDIRLEVSIQTPQMAEPFTICQSNTRHLYWTMAQQLAHHTVNGCNLRAGDLLASGTISGPTPDSYGSLLELAWKGEKPISLPSGETRAFLEDGDRLTLEAFAEKDGLRIGFGACTGVVQPARPYDAAP